MGKWLPCSNFVCQCGPSRCIFSLYRTGKHFMSASWRKCYSSVNLLVNLVSDVFLFDFNRCKSMNGKNVWQFIALSTSSWFGSFSFHRFDLYFRKNPFGGEFTVFAGLEECIKFIANFKFTEHDISFLQSVMPMCEVSSHPDMSNLSSHDFGEWFLDRVLVLLQISHLVTHM